MKKEYYVREVDRLKAELEKAKAQIIADDSKILWQGHEIADLLGELAEAKPFMDALKSRHNGYDPEYRKETGETEPKSPKAALDQLIGEAEALGLAESKAWQKELAEVREDRAAKTAAIIQLHRELAELREAVKGKE